MQVETGTRIRFGNGTFMWLQSSPWVREPPGRVWVRSSSGKDNGCLAGGRIAIRKEGDLSGETTQTIVSAYFRS